MRLSSASKFKTVSIVSCALLCAATICGWLIYHRNTADSAAHTRAVRAQLLADETQVLVRREQFELIGDVFSNLLEKQIDPNLVGVSLHNADGIAVVQTGNSSPHECFLPIDEAAGLRLTMSYSTEASSASDGLFLGLVLLTTFCIGSVVFLTRTRSIGGLTTAKSEELPPEKNTAELSQLVNELRKNSSDVRRQNEELTRLASRDPLTDCLNRRAFFEQVETIWKSARRYDYPVAAIMVDIDHFKSINDQHGHAVGDTVLCRFAAILQNVARETDIVCRYGGEEFAIVLPHADMEAAMLAGERFRSAISERRIGSLQITASFGVSSLEFDSSSVEELLDQADRALYFSKRTGRNKVSGFDLAQAQNIERATSPIVPTETTVPFHAVTALVSALAYRDHATAEHSRRVADLCVRVAESLMSRSDCYYLELAAMLHDIGKVGVPDSILLKPAPLDEAEWHIMHKHQRIGSEIIHASFACQRLSQIVEHHRVFFDGSRNSRGLTGSALPLASRILAIADSFDAMVTDRVFRGRLTNEEAFQELRRCAGTQFDPELVEHFIQVIEPGGTDEKTDRPVVSREAALSIGLQLERLASALDDHDLEGLKVMASRLEATATRDGADSIAAKALELREQMSEDSDLYAVLSCANELMSLCRSAQRSFVVDPETEFEAGASEASEIRGLQ